MANSLKGFDFYDDDEFMGAVVDIHWGFVIFDSCDTGYIRCIRLGSACSFKRPDEEEEEQEEEKETPGPTGWAIVEALLEEQEPMSTSQICEATGFGGDKLKRASKHISSKVDDDRTGGMATRAFKANGKHDRGMYVLAKPPGVVRRWLDANRDKR